MAASFGWLVVVAATTATLVALRVHLDKSHFALAYLLLVLIGTSQIGRRGGIQLAVLCFFCFNFFLLPPYHTLVVADARDWFVLITFLLSSLIAAQLLSRAHDQARVAQQRTEEIDRLSTLGAETLSAGRAEEAIGRIAEVIQSTLGIASCEVFLAETPQGAFRLVGRAVRAGGLPASAGTDSLFEYVIEHGVVAVERGDGAIHVLTDDGRPLSTAALDQPDVRVALIPLSVRSRPVGLLRLSEEGTLRLDAPQRRFAEALAYYAALAAERVRLTAEAEQADALRAADHLKDAFLAAVSHDLRTPLTTIKGLARELANTGDERASIIETEADRLNHLVEDVLDLSRLNAGGLKLVPELNAAEDLVGAALNQMARLPRAHKIRTILPAGELVLGRFDFVHTLRALVNLAENALKYAPPETDVEIEVTETPAQIRFAVFDRGPGIPADSIHKIFEPFVRLDRNSARSGAGLGLAIAHRIAQAQGGSVQYEPRPGGGSIFSLCLPAASHAPTALGS